MLIEWTQHPNDTRTAKVPGGTLVHVATYTDEHGDVDGRWHTDAVYPGGVVFVPDRVVPAGRCARALEILERDMTDRGLRRLPALVVAAILRGEA
jgi:hypothetical protein